ncbi:MAG: hypothetical protein KDI71_17185, partial [Xanthomonadales bacterium]|nr:hypothetical protein [Xanthomonadales bacterium]
RQLHAWATSLNDGIPLQGVEMRLQPAAAMVRSDRQGLARFDLAAGNSAPVAARLEARQGKDFAFLPDNTRFRAPGAWQQRGRFDELRWHVFDDRGLYKPGEEVHLKGWIRVVENRPDGGLGLPKAAGPVKYVVIDSRGNQILDGEAALGALGGFALDFKLPDTPNLGSTRVQLTLPDVEGIGTGGHQHVFQIQEFRTPEFAVDAQMTSDQVFAGETLVVRA